MVSDIEAALKARWPENRMEPDIARMVALMDVLGDPQLSYPVIHVTGTNGKTSTTRMIEALLRSNGLRTGLYTSPHLQDVRERICFDGEPIDEERFAEIYVETAPYFDLIDSRSEAEGGPALSYFEVLTAMAFAAFADAPIDAAAVEVGLGGTWDATNVVKSQVSVIMPVDLDHTEILGDTYVDIALEKSGIIKAGAATVIAEQREDVLDVLLARCEEVGATPLQQGIDFEVLERMVAFGGQQLTLRGLTSVYDEIYLPLFGEHQANNAACALAAVESFLGGDRLDIEVVREAFAAVRVPGRLEVVRTRPTVIVDAAHNPHGARSLAEAIGDSFSFERLVAVVSMFEGKDALRFLDALSSVVDTVVVTRNSSPRAFDPDELGEIAIEVFGDDRVEVVPNFSNAIARAVDIAEEGGDSSLSGLGVLVTGSVATAGDALKLLKRPRRGRE